MLNHMLLGESIRQSWLQLSELALAFVLSALIGLEREIGQKERRPAHRRWKPDVGLNTYVWSRPGSVAPPLSTREKPCSALRADTDAVLMA